jgi:hypothetical protein
MRKIVLFFIGFIVLSTACIAQESRKSIDYQYKRVDSNYHAYTVYIGNEANTVDFAIVSSYDLTGLKSIHIQSEKNKVKLSFKKITLLLNDDETLNKLAISVNLEKVFKAKLNCESTIVFTLENNLTIELPINNCQLKEYLSKN